MLEDDYREEQKFLSFFRYKEGLESIRSELSCWSAKRIASGVKFCIDWWSSRADYSEEAVSGVGVFLHRELNDSQLEDIEPILIKLISESSDFVQGMGRPANQILSASYFLIGYWRLAAQPNVILLQLMDNLFENTETFKKIKNAIFRAFFSLLLSQYLDMANKDKVTLARKLHAYTKKSYENRESVKFQWYKKELENKLYLLKKEKEILDRKREDLSENDWEIRREEY